jgi:hypothetical protein
VMAIVADLNHYYAQNWCYILEWLYLPFTEALVCYEDSIIILIMRQPSIVKLHIFQRLSEG